MYTFIKMKMSSLPYISEKVHAGKRLTRQEEIFYMVKALKLKRKQAEYILNIVNLSKKYPNICFD